MNSPSRGRSSLPLIAPGSELTGVAPPHFERLCRTCSTGDATHRAVVRVGMALTSYALGECMPPGARGSGEALLATVDRWTHDLAGGDAVKKARNAAFNAARADEQATVDAVVKMLDKMPRKKQTRLDEHADSVVLRYVVLAAANANLCALMTADAVFDTALASHIPAHAAGAIAYKFVGLGGALSPELRAAAWAQAEWETERQGGSQPNLASALAIQVFHEFLGCKWRDQSDAQRLYIGEFLRWAVGN